MILYDTHRLSDFLEKYFGDSLIIMEGDKDIAGKLGILLKIATNKESIQHRLHRISEICDYSFDKYNESFLMRKKYSNTLELPCVTSGEYLVFCKNISDILHSRILGDPPQGNSIPEILQSLSESESESIQKDFVPIRNLNPGTQAMLLKKITASVYSSIRFNSDQVLYFSHNLDNSTLDLQNSELQTPLITINSHPKNSNSIGYPLNKDSGESNPELKKINISFESSNLMNVIHIMNKKIRKDYYNIDNSLKNKPICVTNLVKFDTSIIARGISLLYDLKITKNSDRCLIHQKKSIFQDNYNFSNEFDLVMPFPLRRIYQHQNLTISANAQIYSLIPQINKQKSKSFPCAELHELDKSAIMLRICHQLLNSINEDTVKISRNLTNNANNLEIRYLSLKNKVIVLEIIVNKLGIRMNGIKFSYIAQ